MICPEFKKDVSKAVCIIMAKYRKKSYCQDCEIGKKILENEKEKTMENEKAVQERMCTKCGDKFPMTEEYFDKFPKGLTLACRYCRGTKEKPTEQPDPVPATPEKEKPAEQPEPTGKRIVLDFTDCPETWEKVEAWAKTWMRTPANQIVYYLSTNQLKKGKAA